MQTRTSSGETERVQTTLHDRFQSFEERVEAETQQVKELQRQWESVVAEIFQLGVGCLGESEMAALLSTADADGNAESPASRAESTLFVPEHGSEVERAKGKRKRVSFAGPDMVDLFPGFLLHASGHQKSIPATPVLPLEGVQQFEEDIAGLGRQHDADLRRLEKEHKAWWERKQRQLAHTLMQD